MRGAGNLGRNRGWVMTVVGLGSCLALGADADLVQTPELVSGQPVTQVPMGPAGGGVAVV